MDYHIILSPKAVRDLEAVVRYIAQDSPETARKFGQQLLKKAKELGSFPLKGQAVPEFNDPSNPSASSQTLPHHLQNRRRQETGEHCKILVFITSQTGTVTTSHEQNSQQS